MDREVAVSSLMTADEHLAMDLSAKLANTLGRIIRANDTGQGDNDWGEAARHIHDIQHMVMAQAAARAFPSKYRLLGGGFADDTDPTISGDPGVNRTTTLGPDNYGRNDQ